MKLPAEITIEVINECVPTGTLTAEQTKEVILSIVKRLKESELLDIQSAYVAGQMYPDKTVQEFMRKRYGREVFERVDKSEGK